MNFQQGIKPISYIKTNAAEMLRQVNETRNPIVITQNGEAKAVLLDTETYQDMRDSLGIMKILSRSDKDIEDGKVLSNDSVFEDLKNSIRNA